MNNFIRRSFRALLCSLYAFVILGTFDKTTTAADLRLFALSQPGPFIDSQLLEKLPFLLGYERPMNYLILVQITDELRPSGGFMKFIVFMRFENGQPVEIRPHGIETLEPEGMGAFDWVETGARTLPPKPIERYMGLGNWVIRDTNWWGDFRHTADEVTTFWQRAGYEPVDGVIAVNDTAIALLLDVLGGIILPNGERLSGSAFKEYAINNFYSGDRTTWSEHRQSTANNLVSAFTRSALDINEAQSPLILLAAYNQVQNHNIMIYVSDPETAEELNKLGFDGSLRSDNVTDYFYFVEANVSYSKSSPFIERNFDYKATLTEDGRLDSQLTVTLYNGYSRDRRLAFPDFYYEGMRWNPETRDFYRSEGYYGAFERIYLPRNVEIISATGFDDGVAMNLYDPSHAPVVGGYVSLEMQETQEIQVQWTQPYANILFGDTFKLYVQRQSGLTGNLTAELTYPTCAPPDSSSNSAAPQVLQWTDELNTDRELNAALDGWIFC